MPKKKKIPEQIDVETVVKNVTTNLILESEVLFREVEVYTVHTGVQRIENVTEFDGKVNEDGFMIFKHMINSNHVTYMIDRHNIIKIKVFK